MTRKEIYVTLREDSPPINIPMKAKAPPMKEPPATWVILAAALLLIVAMPLILTGMALGTISASYHLSRQRLIKEFK